MACEIVAGMLQSPKDYNMPEFRSKRESAFAALDYRELSPPIAGRSYAPRGLFLRGMPRGVQSVIGGGPVLSPYATLSAEVLRPSA